MRILSTYWREFFDYYTKYFFKILFVVALSFFILILPSFVFYEWFIYPYIQIQITFRGALWYSTFVAYLPFVYTNNLIAKDQCIRKSNSIILKNIAYNLITINIMIPINYILFKYLYVYVLEIITG